MTIDLKPAIVRVLSPNSAAVGTRFLSLTMASSLPARLAGLEFVDPDPDSAEWLEMYRYWPGLTR